jgi:uncharacterized protein
MTDRITVSFDPLLPRALDREWHGCYAAAELPRVQAAIGDGAPFEVEVALVIHRGPLGEIRARARIRGSVALQCQRCLAPLEWLLDLHPDVALVRPEGPPPGLGEADDLVELGPEGLFHPAAFVEDEILLALPIAPRHAGCEAGHGKEFEPGAGDRDVPNPFAVLETLRGKP